MQLKIGSNIFKISAYDLLMFFMIVAAFALDDIGGVGLISQALLFAYTACVVLNNRGVEKYIARFMCWSLVFFILCILSSCWAQPTNVTLLRCSFSTLQVGLISTSVLIYMNDAGRIKKLIWFYIASALIIVLRFFIEVPFSFWGQQTRFTNDSLFGKNETAIVLSYASLFLFWLYLKKGDNREKRNIIVTFGLICVFMLVSVLMGTKSGIIIFAIGFSIILIGRSNNAIKLLSRLLFIIVMIYVGYLAIMTVPVLYNSVGYRIELMITGFMGGSTDASTSMRMNFAIYAFNIFLRNPILGIGLDGFRYVNIFEPTYAHNNYVELLADLGFVGFSIYYFRFIGYFKSCLQMLKQNILPLALLVILLFIDFTGVTYSLENSYIIISIIIAFIYQSDQKEELSEEICYE